MSQLKENRQKSLFRQEEAKKNEGLHKIYQDKISSYEAALKTLRIGKTENDNSLRICRAYLAKKRDDAMEDIRAAILMGNSVISSAGHFQLWVEDNKAALLNDNGIDVYSAEGSAYTAAVSFFARIAIIENSSLQKTFILDEVLTNLSVESSSSISELIKEKSKTCQFIMIEQKPEIFAHGVDKAYFVFKNASTSEVRERRVQ